MSGLHAVSSSDDVKPPLGLKQLSSHSPGPMLSQKRLCSICGDRSSGDYPPSIKLFSVPSLRFGAKLNNLGNLETLKHLIFAISNKLSFLLSYVFSPSR